jgi:16S rRNA (uracil1498-N3)-methyltransferase
MKLHRFILNINLEDKEAVITDPEILKQWHNVLRFQVGDEVLLCDGVRQESLARFERIHKKEARLSLEKPVHVTTEPKRLVILYCAMLKRENFEWVAQKAVEVGAGRLMPILTERTVKKDIRLDRVHKIMKEAAEQSGRGIIPLLHTPLSFKDALTHSSEYDARLLFDASGPAFESTTIQGKNVVALFIGPEGGWSEKELQMAEKSGLTTVNLGPLTLRAETAAIVATYLASK